MVVLVRLHVRIGDWAPPKWNRPVQQEGHLAHKVWYFLGIEQE